jgi:hypothetical protein
MTAGRRTGGRCDLSEATALQGSISSSGAQRNGRSDRARPRAAAAAAQPHRPSVVRCSTAGLAQPIRIHSRTWALRKAVVHIHSRTLAPRTGPLHTGSHSLERRTGRVRIHSRSLALRMVLVRIHLRILARHTQPPHTRSHRRARHMRRFRSHLHIQARHTLLLHYRAPQHRAPQASRRPVRLRRRYRHRPAPHKPTAPQRSRHASMTTLLPQQEQVIGSSCQHSIR